MSAEEEYKKWVKGWQDADLESDYPIPDGPVTVPRRLADAALLELAERCDALSRPEVALRMWKVRAEAAEATVIAKAAQVETLVKERRAERKRAEAAEADAEKWKLLAGERWVQCQHEAQMRDRAEAHVAELERYLKAGREEWLLACRALEQAESRVAALEAGLKTTDADRVHWAQRAKQAEAELERLRCCGNCENWNGGSQRFCEEANDGADYEGWDSCHFTPSRWTERNEE